MVGEIHTPVGYGMARYIPGADTELKHKARFNMSAPSRYSVRTVTNITHIEVCFSEFINGSQKFTKLL